MPKLELEIIRDVEGPCIWRDGTAKSFTVDVVEPSVRHSRINLYRPHL